MTKFTKATAAIIAVLLTVFLLGGCGEIYSPSVEDTTPSPDATEEPKSEVSVTELWEYSIVYPSSYSAKEMEVVYFLRDVLSQITYGKTQIKSDEEKVTSKEIVLASSKRTTGFEWDIQELEGEMDYVIAVGEREIVLGGKGYLADMKAVYDFVQNYLDYDIEGHKFGTNGKKIEGYRLVIYGRDDFNIVAVNNQSAPIETYSQLKAMKNMGFDCVLIDLTLYSEEQLKNIFDLALVLDMKVIMRSVSGTAIYRDSPMVMGHVLAEEPYGGYSFNYYSAELRQYDEAYSSLGWTPFVEMMGQLDAIEMFTENGEYFDKLNDLIFIWKPSLLNSDQNYLHIYELLAENAKENGRKLAAYVEAGDTEGIESSPLYGWMALTGMCFGAEEVWYFNYAPPADSEEVYISDSLYQPAAIAQCVKETNELLRDVREKLSGYEYSGTCLYGESRIGTLETPFEAGLTVEGEGNILVGCFENENGKAFLLVDAQMPEDGTDEEKMKFVLRLDESGKEYTAKVSSGKCAVVFTD